MSGLFGNKTQTVVKSSDPLQQRLDNIKSSLDKQSTNYRFQTVVYNYGSSNARNPPTMTADDWAQAQADAPDTTMFPFVVCGFDGLKNRMAEQNQIIELMKKKLQSMNSAIKAIKEKSNEFQQEIIPKVFMRKQTILPMLIDILEKEEVHSLSGYQFSREEHELLDRIEKLKEDVNRPNRYVAALNTLTLKANLLKDMSFKGSSSRRFIEDLDAEMVSSGEEIMKINNDSISVMIKDLKRIAHVTHVLEKVVAGKDNEIEDTETKKNENKELK